MGGVYPPLPPTSSSGNASCAWSSKRYSSKMTRSWSATVFRCHRGRRLGVALRSLMPRITSETAKVTFCVRGVISPLLSNVYLNDVDTMLERAKTVTRVARWTHVEYARFADDLVVLVD